MTKELTADEAAKVAAFGFDKPMDLNEMADMAFGPMPTHPDPEPLADRVEARIRSEWPGIHTTQKRGIFKVEPIRDGGATAELLKLVHKIVTEESVVS